MLQFFSDVEPPRPLTFTIKQMDCIIQLVSFIHKISIENSLEYLRVGVELGCRTMSY